MRASIDARRSRRSVHAAPLRARGRIPPLENGATLTADEFMRRYKETPEDYKAELIDGVVYIMLSLVSAEWHGIPDGFIQGWIANYAMETPGVQCMPNSTIRLGPKNIPQPDGMLRLTPEYGGKTHIDKDGALGGPVEFAAEVAYSTASIDLGKKLEAYQGSGVAEYLVWRTEENLIDWWRLENGAYLPIEPDKDGIFRSHIFPGLWLDRTAMLKRDGRRVLATLKKGLKSAEYASFVKRLKAHKGKGG
jgi:Uma2 family endonuclease